MNVLARSLTFSSLPYASHREQSKCPRRRRCSCRRQVRMFQLLSACWKSHALTSMRQHLSILWQGDMRTRVHTCVRASARWQGRLLGVCPTCCCTHNLNTSVIASSGLARGYACAEARDEARDGAHGTGARKHRPCRFFTWPIRGQRGMHLGSEAGLKRSSPVGPKGDALGRSDRGGTADDVNDAWLPPLLLILLWCPFIRIST